MPRETVRDQAGMYDTVVEWVPEKYVQVGVETADGRSIADHLHESDPSDSEEAGDQDGTAVFRGLWGTLDRADCNQLIQALRKARDQVYGPDA